MSTTIEMETAGRFLPDLIQNAMTTGDRVILCRGGDPVGVVLSPDELTRIESRNAQGPGGLAALVGKWQGFEEVEPFIEEAYRSRQDELHRPLDLDE